MTWLEQMRPLEVLPSLYAADFARLGEQTRSLLAAGARALHFDVGDGHFVEPVTMGPIVLQSLLPAIASGGDSPPAVDVHLMVANPERHLEQLAKAGAAGVTFHVEAAGDCQELVARARSFGLSVGLAINPGTPVGALLQAGDDVDLVLCMCIEPGYSGQAFQASSLERIATLRQELPRQVRLQVDGGIGPETIGPARDAGADLFVCGSAVFGADDSASAYSHLVSSLTATAPAAGGIR